MPCQIASYYILFSILATVANIGTQDLVVRFYTGPFQLTGSVIFGAGVGLVVKYMLDKRYIFQFCAESVAHDTRTFALYTVMGLVTTAVFLSFEFGFYYLFDTKEMRYFGGVIGLAIGYLVKYHLDKRFVFRGGTV